MTDDPLNSYGFTYRCGDKTYAVDIVAHSVAEAQQRIAAMAHAELCGELLLVGESPTYPRLEEAYS